jgi:RNA methyltransferase, TrmH family
MDAVAGTIAFYVQAMRPSAQRGPLRIESRQNARVKELRAGLRHGVKTSHGRIAIEGSQLVQEAIRSRLRIHTVFVRTESQRLLESETWGNAEILLLSNEVFSSVVTTEHPQGIAALIDPPDCEASEFFRGTPLIVVAGGLQDPGNLGTLVRSAEAFGSTGMILLPGTVSLWNTKVLRASSGSAFRLPVLTMTGDEVFAALRAHGVRLLAAVPRNGDTRADLREPVALLLGNEGSGLPEPWIAQADGRITIPYPGPTESLNAAVAGSVLLYEAARQRAASAPMESAEPSSAPRVEE